MNRMYPTYICFFLTCFALFLQTGHSQEPMSEQHRLSFNCYEIQDEIHSHNLQFTPEAIQLVDPNEAAWLISEPIKSNWSKEGPFIAFLAKWKKLHPSASTPFIQIRGSSDGTTWEAWQDLQIDEHSPGTTSASYSQLLLLNIRYAYLRLRIVFPAHSSDLHPALTLYFFNPGHSQSAVNGTWSAEINGEQCTCPPPTVLSRNEWCPTGNCPSNPNPDTTQVTHLIVHHSATGNTAPDWPAVVRSIWNTHVNVFGWSDIGYNWLIDPNGQIYEGRGQYIQGAHFCGTNAGTTGVCLLGTFTLTPPSNDAQKALQEFLSWQACIAGVHPLGAAMHNSSGLNLQNISGHRDGCNTQCPGDAFYPLFNGIRQGVQNYIDNSCTTVANKDLSVETPLVQIFPNPNSGQFQVQHTFSQAGTLLVFNAQGQFIEQQLLLAQPIQEINLTNLPQGIYWLQLKFADNNVYQKIILQ